MRGGAEAPALPFPLRSDGLRCWRSGLQMVHLHVANDSGVVIAKSALCGPRKHTGAPVAQGLSRQQQPLRPRQTDRSSVPVRPTWGVVARPVPASRAVGMTFEKGRNGPGDNSRFR